MSYSDNTRCSISNILHETAPWFNPEFYVIFLKKFSYGQAKLIFIREKFFKKISSYRTITLRVESRSKMKSGAWTIFDRCIILISDSITTSNIDNTYWKSGFSEELAIFKWFPEYCFAKINISLVNMERISENIQGFSCEFEHVYWFLPVFSQYSESSRSCSCKTRDSHENFLFLSGRNKRYEFF